MRFLQLAIGELLLQPVEKNQLALCHDTKVDSVNIKNMLDTYLKADSMRHAAKIFGISTEKLRRIRDKNNWPLKIGVNKQFQFNETKVNPYKKTSLYEAIITKGGLSEKDLKRALEL
jgi:predicted flavoprotein YhiN